MSALAADGESIAVSRYHGAGNDFLLVDADEPVAKRRAFARRVCDPADGFGVDGVLFLALEPDFTPPRVVMTLVQPDGGTAPMCGNGARCAAAWAMERTDSDVVMIDTQAGSRLAERAGRAADDAASIAVEMARPSVDPATVPVRADEPVVDRPATDLDPQLDAADLAAAAGGDRLRLTVVNTGVPHAVAFVDDVAAVDLERLGPAVRHADAFPRGTNLSVANRVRPSGEADDVAAFDQRTYERGVEAETQACGTGAVAIAAAASRLDPSLAANRWELRPPGGSLQVRFDGHGRAVLEGPIVHESTLDLSANEYGHR